MNGSQLKLQHFQDQEIYYTAQSPSNWSQAELDSASIGKQKNYEFFPNSVSIHMVRKFRFYFYYKSRLVQNEQPMAR